MRQGKPSLPNHDEWDALDDAISLALTRSVQHAEPPARVGKRLRRILRAGALGQPQPPADQPQFRLIPSLVQGVALIGVVGLVFLNLWSFNRSAPPASTLPAQSTGQTLLMRNADPEPGQARCSPLGLWRANVLPNHEADLRSDGCAMSSRTSAVVYSPQSRLSQDPFDVDSRWPSPPPPPVKGVIQDSSVEVAAALPPDLDLIARKYEDIQKPALVPEPIPGRIGGEREG